VTPLFLTPNLNLRPMRAAWFRFPWSAVYTIARSEWPPNLYSTKQTEDNSSGPSLEPTVKGTVSWLTRRRDSATTLKGRPKIRLPWFFGWTRWLPSFASRRLIGYGFSERIRHGDCRSEATQIDSHALGKVNYTAKTPAPGCSIFPSVRNGGPYRECHPVRMPVKSATCKRKNWSISSQAVRM